MPEQQGELKQSQPECGTPRRLKSTRSGFSKGVDATNQFIELYNGASSAVDISN